MLSFDSPPTPHPSSPSLRAAGKTQRREVCNWCDKAGNILLFRRQHNKLEAQLGGGKKKSPKPQEQPLSAAAALGASAQLCNDFNRKKKEQLCCFVAPPPFSCENANDQIQ